jgi:hypothetical protein
MCVTGSETIEELEEKVRQTIPELKSSLVGFCLFSKNLMYLSYIAIFVLFYLSYAPL